MDIMDFMDILWIYYSDFTVFFHNVRWRDFMDILWIFTLQRTFGDGKWMKIAHLQMIYLFTNGIC